MTPVLSWVVGHSAIVAGFIIATIDLVIALNPNWKSNGILHFVLIQAQKLQEK
jgi:hypothetical protein